MQEHELVVPEAFFDSLSIAKKLDGFLDGFNKEEIQLFSYFSLILHVYQGGQQTDWGYSFIVDEKGYPFSSNLNEAIIRHTRNNLFEKRKDEDTYYIISGRGVDEFDKFSKLSDFQKRESILEAACSVGLLIPFNEARTALLNDPNLSKAKNLGGNRRLDSTVFMEFKSISEAIGAPIDDLIIPAVSWVNFINLKE